MGGHLKKFPIISVRPVPRYLFAKIDLLEYIILLINKLCLDHGNEKLRVALLQNENQRIKLKTYYPDSGSNQEPDKS